MTYEQATDIWVRVETAIHALKAAWALAKGDPMAPEADIAMALQYANVAVEACKASVNPERK